MGYSRGEFCTPTASQPSPGNLMDMNHLLSICLAIFHQARDGKQLRNPLSGTSALNQAYPFCKWWKWEFWWSITQPCYDAFFSSVQFSSVAQSCPTICDPMNHSTPGLPVQHQLPEFTQTHVHRVSDAIQPFHPLSSPSPPAPNPSQHQSLFQWGGQSTGVSALASFLPKNTQGWFPLEWTGWISLQSKGLSRVFFNTTVQKHQWYILKWSQIKHKILLINFSSPKL